MRANNGCGAYNTDVIALVMVVSTPRKRGRTIALHGQLMADRNFTFEHREPSHTLLASELVASRAGRV